MSAQNSSRTEVPFGTHKRDRVLTLKAMYWLGGLIAVAVQTCVIYAGNAYLESRANDAVTARLDPIVKKTAEEFEKRLLVSKYDADSRLSDERESNMRHRVADLEQMSRVNRQLIELQKDNFHRLELMLREGFAKQGVTLSSQPR